MDEFHRHVLAVVVPAVGLVLSIAGMVWAGDFRWLARFFAKRRLPEVSQDRRVELCEYRRNVRPRIRYTEPEVLEAELAD